MKNSTDWSVFKFLPALMLAAFIPVCGAATLTWDSDGGTGGAQDGPGTWTSAGTDWFNGSTDVAVSTVATLTSGATTNSSAVVTVANTSGIVVGQNVYGNNIPGGATVLSVDSGTQITISANATATASGQTFRTVDNVIFGSGSGAAGAVTVTGAQTVGTLTFNAPGSGAYTLSGGNISLASSSNGANSAISIASGVSATVNNTIVPLGSATMTINSGATLNLGGGATFAGNPQWIVSGGGTLNLTGGTYGSGNIALWTQNLTLNQGAATLNLAGGRFLIGYGGNTTYTINDAAAVVTQTASGSGGNNANVVGRSGTSGVIDLKQGALTMTTDFQLGVDGGSKGTLTVEGGTLSDANQTVFVNYAATSATGAGTLNVQGGTASFATISFGNGGTFTSGATGTLNVSGGTLYVGSGGIVKNALGTLTTSINLSGGVIGASASWSSSHDMVLGTTNGSITFKAADTGNVMHDITLSGALSGAGGLIKTGGGTLTLSGANTYAGGTVVNAGTLTYGSSFTMQGANQFTLGASGVAGTAYGTVISSGAGITLTTGGTLAVDFSSSFLSGGESFSLFQTSSGGALAGTFDSVSVTGSYIAALTNDGFGVWSGSGSGLNFQFVNSTGVFTVSAIPEPSTYAMIFGALAFGGVCLRRRRSAAKAT